MTTQVTGTRLVPLMGPSGNCKQPLRLTLSAQQGVPTFLGSTMSEINESNGLHTPRFHIKSQNKYEPVDTITETTNTAMVSFLVGSIFAAAKNSTTKQLVGPWGIVKNSGTAVAVLTIGGAALEFGKCVSSNLREKNDALNDFYGGLFGGALVGTYFKTVSKTVGIAALSGTVAGLLSWGGYSLNGLGKDSSHYSIDKSKPFAETTENAPKQGFWEMVYRRPLSQTIHDLGEQNVVFKP